MSRVLWSAYFRVPVCILVFALGYFISLHAPIISEWSNAQLVRDVLSDVSNGNINKIVTDERFAYALACMIVSTAAGIALIVLVMEVAYIRVALWLASRPLAKLPSKKLCTALRAPCGIEMGWG